MMTFLAMFIFLFVIVIVGSSFSYLYLGSPDKIAAHVDAFDALGIPRTGAERHRLLREDVTGDFHERIKEAARRRHRKPHERFIDRWFRQAGVWTINERKRSRNLAFGILVVSTLLSLAFGSLGGFATSLYAGASGAIFGLIIPLFILRRTARSREQLILNELTSVVLQVRAVLNLGLDLGSTLKEVVRAHGSQGDTNAVIILFRTALAEAEAGRDITDALQGVAARVGVQPFTDLCYTLVMTEKRGTGWSAQLDGLSAALRDTAKLERSKGRLWRRS